MTPFSTALCRLILTCAIGASLLWAEPESGRQFSRMDLLDNERIISENDRLRYHVLEEQSPPVTLSTDQEGRVRFPPLMQPVSVVGKTPRDLAHELKALLEVDFFFRATVVIEIAESTFREHATVYGQIANQGRINLPRESHLTITQVISQMGGLLDGADLRNIAVLRSDLENPEKEKRVTVNMDEIINLGMVENDIRIMGGDVIIVGRLEEMGGRYSVLGAVRNPGLFTIQREHLTVSEAILMAGGFTDVARQTRVRLTRRIPDSEETETYYINVRRILQDGVRSEDMAIKPDDIINVSERIIIF